MMKVFIYGLKNCNFRQYQFRNLFHRLERGTDVLLICCRTPDLSKITYAGTFIYQDLDGTSWSFRNDMLENCLATRAYVEDSVNTALVRAETHALANRNRIPVVDEAVVDAVGSVLGAVDAVLGAVDAVLGAVDSVGAVGAVGGGDVVAVYSDGDLELLREFTGNRKFSRLNNALCGRYNLISIVVAGGYGVVLKGIDRVKQNEAVAIKFFLRMANGMADQ